MTYPQTAGKTADKTVYSQWDGRVPAPKLKKFGFERNPLADFSDDGTRFTAYSYGDFRATYAHDGEYHYFSLRLDYADDDGKQLPYSVYSNFPSYGLADEFNGNKELDLEKLVQNAKVLLNELRLWKNGDEAFTDLVVGRRSRKEQLEAKRDAAQKQVEESRLRGN